MKRILKKRGRLAPVRLESERPLSSVLQELLLDRLNLKPHQTYVTSVPLDMSWTWGLGSNLSEQERMALSNPPFTPQWPACLDRNRSIIDQVCEREVLLSYPYESMDAFVQLLREAAADPTVISIKITLYRLARQSHLAEALIAAAESGKQVTALFELRARFDESNNIEWSQRFEEAGCNVIYGFGPREDIKIFLSSADLMTRNMEKRVEIAWPILDEGLRNQVLDYIDTCLRDTAKLRELKADGTYTKLGELAKPDEPKFESQDFLIKEAQRARAAAAEAKAARSANSRKLMNEQRQAQMAEAEAKVEAVAKAEAAAAEAAREAEAAHKAALEAEAAAKAAEAEATAKPQAAPKPAGTAAQPSEAAAQPVPVKAQVINEPMQAPSHSGIQRRPEKPSLLARVLAKFIR